MQGVRKECSAQPTLPKVSEKNFSSAPISPQHLSSEAVPGTTAYVTLGSSLLIILLEEYLKAWQLFAFPRLSSKEHSAVLSANSWDSEKQGNGRRKQHYCSSWGYWGTHPLLLPAVLRRGACLKGWAKRRGKERKESSPLNSSDFFFFFSLNLILYLRLWTEAQCCYFHRLSAACLLLLIVSFSLSYLFTAYSLRSVKIFKSLETQPRSPEPCFRAAAVGGFQVSADFYHGGGNQSWSLLSSF